MWAAESLLVRATSGPVAVYDLLLTLAAVGFCLAASRRAGPTRLGAVIGVVPLAVVVVGVVAPVVRDAWAWGGAVAPVVAILVGCLAVFGPRRPPHPGAVGCALTIAVGLAWGIDGQWPVGSGLVGWLCVLGGVVALTWRPRRGPVLLATAGTVVIGLWPASPPAAGWHGGGPAGQGPDLVVITVDTLRADSAMGMGVVAELAAQQPAVATRAVASAPWTLPSVATLHTGLAVVDHGAMRTGDGAFVGLRPTVSTLAERLSAAGYDTAAVVAPNPWLGRTFGFDRGFAVFDHIRERSRGALPRGPYRGGLGRSVLARTLTDAGVWPQPSFGPAHEVVHRAKAIVDRRRERPLFLWVHLLDPHLPYSHGLTMPQVGLDSVGFTALTRRDVLLGGADPARLRQAYEHEVAVADAALLELLDALGPVPDRGRVVVFTSDHGEEFWEHDGFEHGHALWEEVVSVPLVVSGLPVTAAGPWGLIDVAPTLLAAAGVSREGLPGRDLTQSALPGEAYVMENLMHGGVPDAAWGVRHGSDKVIVRGGVAALFDLATDPGERRDNARAQPDRVKALVRDVHLAGSGDGTPAADLGDEEALLRLLGYVE